MTAGYEGLSSADKPEISDSTDELTTEILENSDNSDELFG